MKRGKVIGAIVLVVAIGLVATHILRETETETPAAAAVDQASEGAGQALQTPGGVPEGARVYTIQSAESEVYWRIYRSGPAARLGHNHVISLREFAGTVALGDDPAEAEWSLSFPVAGLVIDEPELRARYGEDFESEPSDEDKAGTKENMLTEDVLNGEVYPTITLNGAGLTGSLENAGLSLSIQMLGRTIEQVFPAEIVISDDTLTVTGEHRLMHADLGMEPFSIFGGMMAVGDEIDFTYRIHAVAGD